jgi:hypothetical protein
MTDEVIASEVGSSEDPMSVLPVIIRPLAGGEVDENFVIEAYYVFPHSRWRLQFFTEKLMFKEEIVDGSGNLFYPVRQGVLPNIQFYFKLSCWMGSTWSPPTLSKWMRIGLRVPYFRHSGGMVPDRPIIQVYGFPGATVRLYEADSGVVLHGTGIVESGGVAYVRVTEKLPVGDFYMTCNQTINGLQSGWAEKVFFHVRDMKLRIINPYNGSVVSQKPRITGVGHPGSIIKLYQAGWGGVVHGSGKVEDSSGSWQFFVTENLPVGEFPMTASETLDGVEYGYSNTVMLSVQASIEDDHTTETE